MVELFHNCSSTSSRGLLAKDLVEVLPTLIQLLDGRDDKVPRSKTRPR